MYDSFRKNVKSKFENIRNTNTCCWSNTNIGDVVSLFSCEIRKTNKPNAEVFRKCTWNLSGAVLVQSSPDVEYKITEQPRLEATLVTWSNHWWETEHRRDFLSCPILSWNFCWWKPYHIHREADPVNDFSNSEKEWFFLYWDETSPRTNCRCYSSFSPCVSFWRGSLPYLCRCSL